LYGTVCGDPVLNTIKARLSPRLYLDSIRLFGSACSYAQTLAFDCDTGSAKTARKLAAAHEQLLFVGFWFEYATEICDRSVDIKLSAGEDV
jgi:hypothetical protein